MDGAEKIGGAAGVGLVRSQLEQIKTETTLDAEKLVDRIVRRAEEAQAAGQPVRKDDNPEVFRKRLEEFQALQFKVADMATHTHAARLMLYDAAARKDASLARFAS